MLISGLRLVVSPCRYLLLIGGFFFILNCNSQDYGITYTDVIELKERQAKHLAWRYKRAAIYIQYFECNKKYCIELYEGDTQEKTKWFLFKIRIIPKRWHKHIYRYYYIMDEKGNHLDIILE